jgi:hypothetical protein
MCSINFQYQYHQFSFFLVSINSHSSPSFSVARSYLLSVGTWSPTNRICRNEFRGTVLVGEYLQSTCGVEVVVIRRQTQTCMSVRLLTCLWKRLKARHRCERVFDYRGKCKHEYRVTQAGLAASKKKKKEYQTCLSEVRRHYFSAPRLDIVDFCFVRTSISRRQRACPCRFAREILVE